MNYKKMYEETLKNICEQDSYLFDNIVEQEQPIFANKLIPNEKGNLYRFKLNEEIATEEDYKNFCEYIYNYVGLDINDFIENQKSFKSFAKPQ